MKKHRKLLSWIVLLFGVVLLPIVTGGIEKAEQERPCRAVRVPLNPFPLDKYYKDNDNDIYALSATAFTKGPGSNGYGLVLEDVRMVYPGQNYSNPYEYPDDIEKRSDVESVAKAIEADFERMGRGCRRIESYDSPIGPDEYRVALRVREGNCSGLDEWIWDYHFMVQDENGYWKDKHGEYGEVEYHEEVDPYQISWDLNGQIEYYNSPIIYFAFAEKGEFLW